jgi:hypothetical protein
MHSADTSDSVLDRLAPLIGEWTVEAALPGAEGMVGSMTLEPLLGGRFLAQRSAAPDPVPDGFCIIGPATDGSGFVQHYFDSRGVVRVYEMTFDGEVWTLAREKPDFTPLHFAQRYTGNLSADGPRIDGRWERTDDAGGWITDFELTYTRVR